MDSISLTVWLLSLVLAFLAGGLITYIFFSKKIKGYHKQALTDPVTGLYNYKEFTKRLQQELARSQRTQDSFALLLIDIDNFKSINTKYGYKNADILMLQMLDVIQAELRQSDTLFRYRSGDEFAILASHTNCKGAEIMAKRIQEKVASKTFNVKNMHTSLSISIGFSSFESHKSDLEDKAISALRQSKSLNS